MCIRDRGYEILEKEPQEGTEDIIVNFIRPKYTQGILVCLLYTSHLDVYKRQSHGEAGIGEGQDQKITAPAPQSKNACGSGGTKEHHDLKEVVNESCV